MRTDSRFRPLLAASAFLALALLVPAAPAAAVEHTVDILMDVDDDAATGCTVATPAGSFEGAERLLRTTVVSGATDARVSQVALAECDTGTGTFGAAVPFAGDWLVGVGLGIDGFDVVETYVGIAESMTAASVAVRLGVVTRDELGNEDALLETAPGSGEPIRLVFPDTTGPDAIAAIPTASEWALLLLALLLTAAALHLLRRPAGTAFLVGVLLLGAAGALWAEVMLDGDPSEWSVDDLLAEDAVAAGGSSIRAFFGMLCDTQGRIGFRVDTALVFDSAPTVTAPADQTIAESSMTGELAFTVDDTETDPGSLLVTASSSNQTLVPDGNITLGGSGTDRTIKITPAAGESGDAQITIEVEDGAGNVSTDSFLVTVEPNTPPTVTAPDDKTIPEDGMTSELGFTVGDAETDPAALVVTASSSNQMLVPDGNIVLGGTGASRTVKVTPDPDENGFTDVTLTVEDEGGATAQATFRVTVTSANDPPTISSVADQTIPEDDMTGVLGFTVGDVETAAADLIVTATSSDTTLVPNGNITLGGTDENRTVKVTPAPNENGVTTITLTVQDTDGGSVPTTFDVTVTAVEDDPTISVIADQTIPEDDMTGAIPFTVGDAETAPGALLVTASSSNTTLVPNTGANITLGGSGADRTIKITPAANENGVTTITVTVEDGAGRTAIETFDVTVTAVNDPPVADNETVTALCNVESVVEVGDQTAEPTGQVFLPVSDNVLVGDSDPVEGDTPFIVAVSNGVDTDMTEPFEVTTTEGGSVTLWLDGSFEFTPEAGDRSVADTFFYTIEDTDGGQATATVTVNVGSTCVWFVDNSNNSGTDDTGTGTSSDPFTSLVDEIGPDNDPDDAEDASTSGDFVYVFEGDSTSGDPYLGGFTAEANETILGEGVDLVVGLDTLFDSSADSAVNPPLVDNPSGDAFTVADVTGVEIAGFELDAGDNALDVSSSAAPVGLAFHDNTISGSTNQAILVAQGNGASVVSLTDNTIASAGNGIEAATTAGTLELAVDGNTGIGSTGAGGIDLDGTGGGTLLVTSLCANGVSGTTVGTGIVATGIVFDADPSAAGFDEVTCTSATAIGSSGDTVGGSGLVLQNVTGDLDLGQLDVFAGTPGGGDETGLLVVATGTFDAGAETGFQLTTTGGTIVSVDGPAVDIDPTSLETMVLTGVTSANSATVGIGLDEVSGSFQVTGTTDVDAAAVAGIDIRASSVAATFGTTDIDNTVGDGVSYTNSNTGSASFAGTLTIDTTTGDGFVADAGGTVTVTGGSSAIATTTGTAVSVTNSTIGAGGMIFSTVSAGTMAAGPVDGIVLTNAGANAFSAAGGALENVTGKAVDINGGTGSFTYGGTIGTTATGRSVEVTAHKGGALLFGAITDPGLGIHLDDNDGATMTFSGTLDLDTGSDTAFNAVNGGTVNVTASGNDVDTTTGIGVRITGTTIGASGVEFESVSVNGAANGIVLDNTGSGAFEVTGQGTTDGSGGLITNTTGHGVVLDQAQNVTLRNLDIGDPAATVGQAPDAVSFVGLDGINAVDVTNLVLTNVMIGRTENQGIDGTRVTGFSMSDSEILNAGDDNEENCLDFGEATGSVSGLFGTATISNSVLDGCNESGIEIRNFSGTLALTISDTTISNNQGSVNNVGEEGILISPEGTSSMTILIQETAGAGTCLFDQLDTQGVDATPIDSSTLNLTIDGCTFTDLDAGDGAIKINPFGTASTNVTIENNTFGGSAADNISGDVIFIKHDGTGNLDATVQGNTVGSDGVADSGSAFGDAFEFVHDGNGTARLLVGGSTAGLGNNFFSHELQGIIIKARRPGANAAVDNHVTIQNNVVRDPEAAFVFVSAIEMFSRDENDACAHILANTSGGDQVDGITVSQGGTGGTPTFGLQGFTSGTAAAFLTTLNPNSEDNDADPERADTSGTFINGGTCQTPASTPAP